MIDGGMNAHASGLGDGSTIVKFVSALIDEDPQASFIALTGHGTASHLLALDFDSIEAEDVLSLPCSTKLQTLDGARENLPRFIVGLLSYDDFAAVTTERQRSSRFWRVNEAIFLDPLSRKVGAIGRRATALVESAATRDTSGPTEKTPFSLRSLTSAADYLGQARAALEDIRNGRYYQINLLRYFEASVPACPRAMLQRLGEAGGPESAWIRDSGLEIVSFSPETFVTMRQRGGDTLIETFPIKGTAARDLENPVNDAQLGTDLYEDSKNRAELNMIMDLMRNDLQRVSKIGSVHVQGQAKLQTLAHVHHLFGHVRGEVRPQLSLGTVLQAICPAGSITGAPKVEVMRAIHHYEGRSRGYLMGNLFLWDLERGCLHSSVLIRTMYRLAKADAFLYAAGSGLTLKSNPASELEEIAAKCKVIGSPDSAI